MKFLISILFLLVPTLSHAIEVIPFPPDEKTTKVCNDVILNIYYSILDEKNDYKELSQFDDKVLYENQYGIYSIVYQYEPPATESGRKTPYAFAVTIDGLADETFPPHPGSFNFGFPGLGLKISGYQQKHLLRSQFNVLPLIDEHGKSLAQHQQEYLPLRLFLKTVQDSYKIKEDIEFQVILTNVSKRHMVVRDLSKDTLFFLFNDEYWGTSPSQESKKRRRSKNVILKAGESLEMRFKGESFQRPRTFDIYCVYRMAINGVNPSGILTVQVVE